MIWSSTNYFNQDLVHAVILGLETCHFGVPINSEAERIEYNLGVYIARM